MQTKTAISTPAAPAAIGPYSQAVRVGDMLFTSGQVPTDPKTGVFVPGGITEQTTQVLENIKAILAHAGIDLIHVVKTTVYLMDMKDFAAMNEVYAKYLAPPGAVPPPAPPSRSPACPAAPWSKSKSSPKNPPTPDPRLLPRAFVVPAERAALAPRTHRHPKRSFSPGSLLLQPPRRPTRHYKPLGAPFIAPLSHAMSGTQAITPTTTLPCTVAFEIGRDFTLDNPPIGPGTLENVCRIAFAVVVAPEIGRGFSLDILASHSPGL